MTIVFREIGFASPGYRVGSDGTVWTRKNARWGLRDTWRPLQRPMLDGYPTVNIMMPSGKARTWRIHVLVLLLFRGPRPVGADCCHENGDRSDPRLENLRWDTRAANMRDAIRHGSVGVGAKSHAAKLTEVEMELIRRSKEPGTVLAIRHRVSQATISRVRLHTT
ncbi:MAG: HNH endonuclease signature motif containing protein [Pseudomonadota bacterium]